MSGIGVASGENLSLTQAELEPEASRATWERVEKPEGPAAQLHPDILSLFGVQKAGGAAGARSP